MGRHIRPGWLVMADLTIGDSVPIATAKLGAVVEIEGIRMHVMSIGEDGSRRCHDRMAHRFWTIPPGTRCLIVSAQ